MFRHCLLSILMAVRRYHSSKVSDSPRDSPSTDNSKATELYSKQTRHPTPQLNPNAPVFRPASETGKNTSSSIQRSITPFKHAVQSSNSISNQTFAVAVAPIKAKTPPCQQCQLLKSPSLSRQLTDMTMKTLDMEVKLMHLNNLIQRTRPTDATAEEVQLEGEEVRTPFLKLIDLDNLITKIEAEINLLSAMIGLLTYVNEVNLHCGHNFYYSKVYEQRLLSVEFRQSLKQFYECRVADGYVCPVLGFVVPPVACIASHLFKHEWASVVDQVMGFTDINDVRNGLMLFSAVEEAFDNLRLCFYKNQRGELVCWVLDPTIMNQNMLDTATQQQKNQGKEITDPGDRLVRTCFYSLQDKPLQFQNKNRPFNRVLNFQARQAISNAIVKEWITVEDAMEKFVDYYSDGFDWDNKISPWLDHKLMD